MKNGVVTKAQEASFRSEMAAVKEAVHMRIAGNITADEASVTRVEYEPVPLEDAYKWKDTLRLEVAFWRDYSEFEGMDMDVSDLDDRGQARYVSKINNNSNNFGKYMSDGGENVRGIYYVKESGYEEKKYIYDRVYDIVYKIPVTRISKYKVHSVEELDYQQTKVKPEMNKREYTPVNHTVGLVGTGSIKYYEPDLNGLAKETTSLVFYKVNGDSVTTATKEMSVNEWISNNRPNKIEDESGNEYILYDYENRIWANIRVINNMGTPSETKDDVETWWTWIPRYAYKNTDTTTDIVFITTENKQAKDNTNLPEEYKVEKAFEGNSKKGIWISKYEHTSKTTTNTGDWAYYIPDTTGLDTDATELALYDNDAKNFVDYKKLSEVTNIRTFAKENNWFDYYNNRWANIKITKNGAETWWVWIPRYAYSNTGTATDIIFIDVDNEPIDGSILPASYKIPKSFEGNNKKGIWVSKYEHTSKATTVPQNINTVPDLTGLTGTNIKVYLETYNDTKTGFNANPTEYTTSMNLEQFARNNNWYDYSKQAWANIKVVNTKGTESTNDDVETWWVWIPRYAYKNTGAATDIILIGTDNKDLSGNALPEGYKVQKAFEGNSKNGVWINKYEFTEK